MFRRRKPDEPGRSAMPSPAPKPSPVTAPTADSGLGVPPFRPVAKEPPAMNKPLSVPTPPQPAAGGAPLRMPGAAPARSAETADRRTLVVGRGISLQGTVQDAERLVVEGTVEASMIHATELAIAQGGVFKGEVEVDDAEIAGTLDGTLTARGTLALRATGKLLGTARCRRLQVEEGGQISGQMQMLTDTPAPRTGDAPAPATAQSAKRPAPVPETAAE